MISQAYFGDTAGLDSLWISGSAAPSADDFTKILALVNQATDGKVKKIIDLDLRQESHGYLNGDAINLTIENNWINSDKNDKQIIVAEQKWLNGLNKQSHIENVLTPLQFKENDYFQGKRIPVQLVSSEKTVAEQAGLTYIRLMVNDHMAPRDTEVDQFVSLVRQLSPDTWLHVHCRGGAGRTTTFLAMYDMLHNADLVSFNDIINRQAAVAPHYDLFDVDRHHLNLNEYYQKRLAFLQKFYQFSQVIRQGYQGNWSDWIKDHEVD